MGWLKLADCVHDAMCDVTCGGRSEAELISVELLTLYKMAGCHVKQYIANSL